MQVVEIAFVYRKNSIYHKEKELVFIRFILKYQYKIKNHALLSGKKYYIL